MYKAEILADSLNPKDCRLTTMKITFPRIMLAEFNTHRMFSRNSASSRAIPFKKMVQMVQENPFIPIAWQKDHKGMQGSEYIIDEYNLKTCIEDWLEARNNAVKSATDLSKGFNKKDNEGNWIATEPEDFVDGVTKQLCNRLLEPFMWHTVIVTSGKEGLDNFYKLRCPEYQLEERNDYEELVEIHSFKSKKDVLKEGNWYSTELKKFTTEFTDLDWLQINKSQADIHIQAIAELMWDAMNESTPKQLQAGEWHIPFGDNFNEDKVAELYYEVINNDRPHSHISSIEETKIKIATARCARISYETLGENPKIDYEADIRLHDMLAESGHWSPFEHVARAMSDEEYDTFFRGRIYVNQNEPDYKEQNEFYRNNGSGRCRNFRGFIQYRHLIEKNEINKIRT
jgi:thymidylate synthase ThyX